MAPGTPRLPVMPLELLDGARAWVHGAVRLTQILPFPINSNRRRHHDLLNRQPLVANDLPQDRSSNRIRAEVTADGGSEPADRRLVQHHVHIAERTGEPIAIAHVAVDELRVA